MKMKKKISLSLDPSLVGWLDKEVKHKTFASRSHGCQVALMRLRDFMVPLPANVKTELVELDPDMGKWMNIEDDKTYAVSG